MKLHDLILNSERGDYSFSENSDYPEGITPDELSKISISFNKAKFLFVPAYLVLNSKTSRRISNSGKDLNSRYVVYANSRRGVGHENDYG